MMCLEKNMSWIYTCIPIHHQWRHHQEAKDAEAWGDHSLVTNVSGIYRTHLESAYRVCWALQDLPLPLIGELCAFAMPHRWIGWGKPTRGDLSASDHISSDWWICKIEIKTRIRNEKICVTSHEQRTCKDPRHRFQLRAPVAVLPRWDCIITSEFLAVQTGNHHWDFASLWWIRANANFQSISFLSVHG